MLKVVVFNTDAEFALSLRNELHASRDARIVAELINPDELIPTVQRLAPDVVIIYLHPKPDPLLTLASRLSRTCQNARIFAIADSDDPQLILTSMRSGMCEFLTKPINAEELRVALAKVTALKPPGAGKGKIIAVVRSTGGCGATFLAVNTACELVSSCEQSAVIVDLDFCGGQVATYLDLIPSFTLGDLAENSETLDTQMLERILSKHNSGVAVIARPTPLSQGELLQSPEANKLIIAVISTLTDMYDYVIMDGLSPTDPNGVSLLQMADNIILVMNLLVPSIRNACRILEDMTRRHGLGDVVELTNGGSGEYVLDRILPMINRLGRESSYLRIADVEKTLNRKIFAHIPDDWRTVSRSINAGDPLQVYAPNSKIRSSLVDVSMRLAGKHTSPVNQYSLTGTSRKRHAGSKNSGNGPGLLRRMLHRASDRDRSGRKSTQRLLVRAASEASEAESNR